MPTGSTGRGSRPAVSESLCEVCLEGIVKARQMGLTVSCDLNYRAKLWQWGKKAKEVMPEMVRHCDIAVGNEEDADKVFGIKAPDTDVAAGRVEAEKFAAVAEGLKKAFPNLKLIGITLRGSLSASHNTWSGILYDGARLYTGPVFDITDIVDRVGGGDAFVGGLIYGLRTYGDDLQKALDFADRRLLPEAFRRRRFQPGDGGRGGKDHGRERHPAGCRGRSADVEKAITSARWTFFDPAPPRYAAKTKLALRAQTIIFAFAALRGQGPPKNLQCALPGSAFQRSPPLFVGENRKERIWQDSDGWTCCRR